VKVVAFIDYFQEKSDRIALTDYFGRSLPGNAGNEVLKV
jgi:hypothetical protein